MMTLQGLAPQGGPIAVDFGIVSPFTKKNLEQPLADEIGGYERLKDLKYVPLCGERGILYLPVVVGALGLPSSKFSHFLSKLSAAVAQKVGSTPGVIARDMRNTIGLLLMRGCWARSEACYAVKDEAGPAAPLARDVPGTGRVDPSEGVFEDPAGFLPWADEDGDSVFSPSIEVASTVDAHRGWGHGSATSDLAEGDLDGEGVGEYPLP